MSSTPGGRGGGYEMVHVWPKVPETERFITNQNHATGLPGTAYTNYEYFEVAPTPPPRKFRYFGLRWWSLEILALAVSIACFVAIVIVLRIYDGRAVSELRLPKSLTLNAIVAALATVSRASLMVPVAAALMQELWLFFAIEAEKRTSSSRLSHLEVFDSASRGTWGSLILLFRFHGRRLFASLASLITILSLVFGTFIQQSIAYDRLVNLDASSPLAPGNVPRTESWTRYIGAASEGCWTPPLDFIASFYDGVLRGGIAPPSIPCSAGNCTWPPTPSMAICGGCVSSKPRKVFCYDKDQFCNYTMPSGSVAQLWNFEKTVGYGNVPGFQILSGEGAHYDVMKGNRAYVSNFDLVGAPYDSFLNEKLVPHAHECALWMCVQTYNTSVKSGKFEQTVISQVNDLDARRILEEFDGMDEHAAFPPLPAEEDPDHTTKFVVDRLAFEGIRLYLGQMMNGTVMLNLEGQIFSSDLVHGIWNGTTDLDSWIDNLALSMTGVLRTSNTTSRPQYNGTAHEMGVHIRWLWLLLPVVLIALSLLVLLAAIARTAASPVGAWKGSPLTFLLFGVDQHIRDEAHGHAFDHHGFHKAVGAKKVRMVEEGGTFWNFKVS